MTTDSAINFLKKRKEEASKVDPATTPNGIASNIINNVVGAMSGIAEIFLKHTGKTEIVNQPKVSVSNFPKVKDIDLTPVVKAIKEIPSPKETDVDPVVKAIKDIPQTKQLDITPILRAINNLPIPEPIDFSPVVKAIKDIPEPKKFPEEFKVKNQIALDKVESLLSQTLTAIKSIPTSSESKDGELLINELRSLFSSLTEAVQDSRTDSVRVINPGDFPVSPAHAAFKKSDGTIGYGLVDNDSHTQVDVLTIPDIVIEETAPTDSSKTNGSLVITYNASDQPITIEKTISGTVYTKTLTWVGDVCTAVSSWS